MKKIDKEGLCVCAMQAKVFAESLKATHCGSPIFIQQFMESKVASRMDKSGFMFEACDVNDILEEVETQYGASTCGKERYDIEELHWIGYLYRYWAYTYEISSKQVYKLAEPNDLRNLYYPYHSLDPAQAIERIMEGMGIPANYGTPEYYTEQGVKVMRRILERKKKAKNQTVYDTQTLQQKIDGEAEHTGLQSEGNSTITISITELKDNLEKYLLLAENADIYISHDGRIIAKLSNPYQDRVETAKSLFGVLPAGMTLEEAKQERLEHI